MVCGSCGGKQRQCYKTVSEAKVSERVRKNEKNLSLLNAGFLRSVKARNITILPFWPKRPWQRSKLFFLKPLTNEKKNVLRNKNKKTCISFFAGSWFYFYTLLKTLLLLLFLFLWHNELCFFLFLRHKFKTRLNIISCYWSLEDWIIII